MPSLFSLVGALGIVIIELSYVPQIVRIIRRGSAEDVSAVFLAMNVAGRICAMAYAMSRGDGVFTLGFTVGSFVRATLLTQVLVYRLRARRVASPSVTALVPVSVEARP